MIYGTNQTSKSYTKLLELFHGKVMLEKQLQGPCNSTETN